MELTRKEIIIFYTVLILQLFFVGFVTDSEYLDYLLPSWLGAIIVVLLAAGWYWVLTRKEGWDSKYLIFLLFLGSALLVMELLVIAIYDLMDGLYLTSLQDVFYAAMFSLGTAFLYRWHFRILKQSSQNE